MITTFHKGSCFRIQTSGVNLTIQIPDGNISRIKTDILIQDSPKSTDNGAEQSIKGPGEYEIKGIRIRGFHPSTYLIRAEDIKLVYLGILDSDIKKNENIGDPDILLVAAEGITAEIIRQIHPKIVAVISDSDGKNLEKELGIKAEKMDKLSIKKKDIIGDKESKLRLWIL